MSSAPTVAVVVVSHNTKDLLLECLASIFESTGNHNIETIVVDNASSDGSYEAVCHTYPQVVAIRNTENRGFGAACNQAITATVAPFVLLLNSDARITAAGFNALLDSMQKNERCAAAGCLMVNSQGEPTVNTRNFLTPLNQALEQAGITRSFTSPHLRRTYVPIYNQDRLDCSVDWIDGACLMLRRAALEETGLFDERFFMYSEDEDLCFRLRKHGWSICQSAQGSVIHHGGASAAQDRLAMLRQFYASQMLFLLKHRGRLSMKLYEIATKTVLLFKNLARVSREADEYHNEFADRLIALKQAREFLRGR